MSSVWKTGYWLGCKVASLATIGLRCPLHQDCCHHARHTGWCSTPHSSPAWTAAMALTCGSLMLGSAVTALALLFCGPSLLSQTPKMMECVPQRKPREVCLVTATQGDLTLVLHSSVVRGKHRKPLYQTSWTHRPALAACRTSAGKTYDSVPSQCWKYPSNRIWKQWPKPSAYHPQGVMILQPPAWEPVHSTGPKPLTTMAWPLGWVINIYFHVFYHWFLTRLY